MMTIKQSLIETMKKSVYQSGKQEFYNLLNEYLISNGFKSVENGVAWRLEVFHEGLKIEVYVSLQQEYGGRLYKKYEATRLRVYVTVNHNHQDQDGNNKTFDLQDNNLVNVLSEIKKYFDELPDSELLMKRLNTPYHP